MNSDLLDKISKEEEKSFGTVINNFYELEPTYVKHFKNYMAKKAWVIGLMSLCNINVADKA